MRHHPLMPAWWRRDSWQRRDLWWREECFYGTWSGAIPCGEGWMFNTGTPSPPQSFDPSWLPDTHPAAPLFPPPSRMGGENKMEKVEILPLLLPQQQRGTRPCSAPLASPDLLLTGAGGCRQVEVCPVVAVAARADGRGLGGGAAVGGAWCTDPRALAGLERPRRAGCKRKERKAVGC